VRIRPYTGKPTFLDQIITSLLTVFTGFLLATVIAVPLGVLTGLSANVYRSINPIVQIFRPVSPLAWLPIVTIIVSAVYVSEDPMFSKSYVTSAITVTLCCLWPTLINTAVGVSSMDRPGECRQGAASRLVYHGVENRPAICNPDDLHRPASEPEYWLDGADCSRDACTKPGTGKIRLG
jgi:ABC-type anion transport system duplicated permease subunit